MTQTQALSILKTRVNVFLTGEPGSGKTHTINKYVAYLRAHDVEPAITASTGIAATHINGMTIHSWCGIGIKTKLEKNDLTKITSSQYISRRVLRAKVLIIEEVSMLTGETLSMVDLVCQKIRKNSDPFGGLQVIFAGDFFQLPPVVKNIPAHFAFESDAWASANPVICYLTEQHRQDDDSFLSILSALRHNTFEISHLEHLETRKIAPHAIPENVPKLYSHNANVDLTNDAILAKLSGEPHIFTLTSYGLEALVTMLKKGCLSPEILNLKVGAAVMFTKNNPKELFVNGTLGMVEGFDIESGYPIVKTKSGRIIEVEPMAWTIEENDKILAQITQFPLRLAWAITVHKSQGMNLDEAVVDLSGVFEFGQGYVALSRVKRLSGLYILGWNQRTFEVHPEILNKDIQFHAQSKQAEREYGKSRKFKGKR